MSALIISIAFWIPGGTALWMYVTGRNVSSFKKGSLW